MGCGRIAGQVVTFTINPDTPAPSCAIVASLQRLRVVNATNAYNQPGKTIIVYFANQPDRVVVKGRATTYQAPFGTYLAEGQHILRVSYFGDNADMIVWLK